eukprot:CAMPEP_0116025832 /NCGR_PEP_ID=MMETSP0321-20121206/13368_1 /TAXON_ID=163516 /ORGANISM="Leptocylindrus danicus var. danicus, Strain B650" /LENGTH=250 /DNA_ID=CAMNT_0003498271 /DNA_START=343 /DNA_END=1094 /DNA_ORIENTATION=-
MNSQNSSSQRITLLIPWVEDRHARELLYGKSICFEDGAPGREQQAEFIRQWSVENTGLPKDVVDRYLRIRFYPAKYVLPSSHDNLESIRKILPKATTLPVSFEVLQKLKEEDNDDSVSDDDIKLLCVDFQGREKMYSLRDVLRTSPVNETTEETSSVSVQSKEDADPLKGVKLSEDKDDDETSKQQKIIISGKAASETDHGEENSSTMTRVELPPDDKLERLDKDPNYKIAQAAKTQKAIAFNFIFAGSC